MSIKNGDLPAMPNIAASGIATSERELAEMLSEGRVTIGMTKREYLAAMAMQGICSSGPTVRNFIIASEAVQLADALLAELERTK